MTQLYPASELGSFERETIHRLLTEAACLRGKRVRITMEIEEQRDSKGQTL